MNEIIIKVDIIWSKKNHNTITLKNGMIRIFKSQIYVSGEITTAEFLSFSSAYPASIDLYADMKKSIRYSNAKIDEQHINCLLYTSPSPRDRQKSRMPSSA